MERLYQLNLRALWSQFWQEHFSFWMICAYLFVEYVRPQSIIPSLEILPWQKLFLGLAALGLFADRSRKWVRDPANVWMTVFLIVILLSSIFAEYPYEARSHWFDFIDWYIIYFLIINIVNTTERYFIFLCIFLLASFKLSLFGARTWAGRGFAFTKWGLQGPPGFFENSGELSIQMLMFSPIAFYLAQFLRPRILRVKYWILIMFPVTGAMTVMGASSRGGQLGLVYQAYRLMLKGKLSTKTLLAIGVLGYLGFTMLPEEQKTRFMASGHDNTSIQRLLYWKHGIEMVEDHPILGVGYFNFAPYYYAHYPQDAPSGKAELPHNIFIQVATDSGLVGLTVFLMLLYRNLRTARQIQLVCGSRGSEPTFAGNVAKGLAVALWGFVIAGQFVTVTYYPFFWINLALTVSLANVVARPTPDPSRPT